MLLTVWVEWFFLSLFQNWMIGEITYFGGNERKRKTSLKYLNYNFLKKFKTFHSIFLVMRKCDRKKENVWIWNRNTYILIWNHLFIYNMAVIANRCTLRHWSSVWRGQGIITNPWLMFSQRVASKNLFWSKKKVVKHWF